MYSWGTFNNECATDCCATELVPVISCARRFIPSSHYTAVSDGLINVINPMRHPGTALCFAIPLNITRGTFVSKFATEQKCSPWKISSAYISSASLTSYLASHNEMISWICARKKLFPHGFDGFIITIARVRLFVILETPSAEKKAQGRVCCHRSCTS